MNIMKKLTVALGWCALVNFGILTAWLLVFIFARDLFHQMHTDMLRLRIPPETLDAIHISLMGWMKMLVLVLNLVPFLVLLALTRGDQGEARP